MQLRRTKLATAVALAMWGTASAQEMMHIYVTGSNIRRTDTETASPLEIITREDIQASGLQTISDVLRQITANNNGSISPSFTNGFSASGSAVSLRGLGPNNTLVLLNGRRLANFGLADDQHASYVDLQQIPFDAVERIEVLKDGASAIYGSDAVAGVVNVILRQAYTGVTATATAGTLYNREGNQIKGALTMGAGDLTKDGYNVFLTVDGHKQDAIPANRGRQYAGTNDLRFMGLPDRRNGSPPGSSLLGNVIAVNAAKPDGPTIPPFQSLPGPCATKNQDGPGCRWEGKDYYDLLPSIERYNIFARGMYEVGDGMQAYAEASYFHVKTYTRATPRAMNAVWSDPATGAILSTNTIYLPVGHPDNPFGASNQVARLRYADGALGGSDSSYDTGTQRYLAGVKGTNAAWDWDVAALYIRSDTDIVKMHGFSYDRLLQGLAGTGPYGYYRIGASAPQNDPAIYEWIAPRRAYSTFSENTVVDAKASRDMYQLQGGQLALAVGYEFLREVLHNPGIPGTDTGNVVGGSHTAATGSRTMNAFYAELYAPLLRNLDVTAAVRYDNYSDFGSTTNPKIGVKWSVAPEIVLRGTWQTAFRAPGLYESGGSTIGGAFLPYDPVRCPPNHVGTDCSGGSAFTELVGNPSLHPETSTTYTAGFIWEPIRGLSAIIDYWNIRTKGQITFPDTQAIIENPAAFPGLRVVRDTDNLPGVPNSGTILFVGNQWQNANLVETDGIDLDVVWKQGLGPWGTLRTELQWTHVFNFNQSFANNPTYHFVGTQGQYVVSSGAGTPQDRANLILGWTNGPLTVTGTVRYVSGLESISWRGAKQTQGCLSLLDGPDCHVASFTTLDLSAAYSGFKNWQVFGSIINVFNRLAPFNPAAGYGNVNYNFNWAYSGATGTQFNLGARYTFQ
jgi:iron complex outermembrane recepter protein